MVHKEISLEQDDRVKIMFEGGQVIYVTGKRVIKLLGLEVYYQKSSLNQTPLKLITNDCKIPFTKSEVN